MADSVEDEWVEVARVPLPTSMSNLSDDELEAVRQEIEIACGEALLVLIDGGTNEWK